MDKAGILLDKTESDGSESNCPELKLKYNLKKALAAYNRSIALYFLKRAHKTRYSTLWTDLEIQYTRGTDQYPKDLTAAYNMLLNYRKQHHNNNRQRQGTRE